MGASVGQTGQPLRGFLRVVPSKNLREMPEVEAKARELGLIIEHRFWVKHFQLRQFRSVLEDLDELLDFIENGFFSRVAVRIAKAVTPGVTVEEYVQLVENITSSGIEMRVLAASVNHRAILRTGRDGVPHLKDTHLTVQFEAAADDLWVSVEYNRAVRHVLSGEEARNLWEDMLLYYTSNVVTPSELRLLTTVARSHTHPVAE